MKTRSVKQLLYSTIVSMGGQPVRQPIPTANTEQIDPFILLHHHTTTIEAGTHTAQSGVGPHPHRGFSPVTFIYKGAVHHRDSRGNSSVVNEGGIQWMNAGMGVIHSERIPEALSEKGGDYEIIQLWVNTPAAHKMDQPKYIPLQAGEMPVLKYDNGKAEFALVTGEQQGLKGPIEHFYPMTILNGKADKDAEVSFSIPKSMNATMYLLDGEIFLDGFGLVSKHHLIWFNNDEEEIRFTARENTRILVLAAEPINEPLATYGPFVMNNQTELMQAMRDYQMGKMGMLIEEDHS